VFYASLPLVRLFPVGERLVALDEKGQAVVPDASGGQTPEP
jgi:hypothetical protein